jgi:hypothetical protein
VRKGPHGVTPGEVPEELALKVFSITRHLLNNYHAQRPNLCRLLSFRLLHSFGVCFELLDETMRLIEPICLAAHQPKRRTGRRRDPMDLRAFWYCAFSLPFP